MATQRETFHPHHYAPPAHLVRYSLMRKSWAQDDAHAQAWASKQPWWPRVVRMARSNRAWTWFVKPEVKR